MNACHSRLTPLLCLLGLQVLAHYCYRHWPLDSIRCLSRRMPTLAGQFLSSLLLQESGLAATPLVIADVVVFAFQYVNQSRLNLPSELQLHAFVFVWRQIVPVQFGYTSRVHHCLSTFVILVCALQWLSLVLSLRAYSHCSMKYRRVGFLLPCQENYVANPGSDHRQTCPPVEQQLNECFFRWFSQGLYEASYCSSRRFGLVFIITYKHI